eukprot:6198239-Pleurochrysis_carterae.AAC.8
MPRQAGASRTLVWHGLNVTKFYDNLCVHTKFSEVSARTDDFCERDLCGPTWHGTRLQPVPHS